MIEQLEEEKFKFIRDLQEFNNMCYEISLILSKHNYFLRIFELKDKYRQLLMKEPKKLNIVRQLSSCLIEKHNGFQVISIEFGRKQKKVLSLLILFTNLPNIQKLNQFVIIPTILLKPTPIFTQLKTKANVFFSCYECYYCRKIFLRQGRQKRHMENCSGVFGVIYNFDMHLKSDKF